MALNLATGSGAASGVLQALAGPGITVGGVALTDMEVPEKLTWGGGQQLVVHRLLGGQRVVDALGPDDRTLDWSGLMRGMSAVSRARQLDALRNSGAKQVLTWSDFTYTVVVQSFEADYTRQGYRVPYRISCLVIPQPAVPAKPGLLDSIKADIASALDLDAILPGVQQALTVAQAALPVAAVLTKGSAAFVGLSSAVGTASGVVGAATSLAGAQVGSLASSAGALGHLIGGTDGLGAIAALQSAGSATAALASSVLAGSFLGRASANLGSASP